MLVNKLQNRKMINPKALSKKSILAINKIVNYFAKKVILIIIRYNKISIIHKMKIVKFKCKKSRDTISIIKKVKTLL